MNVIYLRKRKYASLVISLLLHAIIFLFILFSTNTVNNLFWPGEIDNNEENFFPQSPNNSPAKVSFNTNQALSSQIENQSIEAPINPNIAAESLPTTLGDQEEDVIKDIKDIVEQQPEYLSPEDIEQPEENFSDISETKENSSTSVIEDRFSRNNFVANLTPKAKKKQKVSAAEFVKAFQSSYKISRMQNRTSETENSENNYRARVNERLSEWRDAHFLSKIRNAIIDASKIYNRQIYVKEDVEKDITMNLCIDDTGKLIDAKFDVSTGQQNLDEYLIDFLRSAQWPRIPKQLNSKVFNMPLKVRIHFPQGWGFKITCHF